jgi:hypothetical protein
VVIRLLEQRFAGFSLPLIGNGPYCFSILIITNAPLAENAVPTAGGPGKPFARKARSYAGQEL